jgi:putative FmdB family regulatory protein
MPIYEYECPKCGKDQEFTMSVKSYETSVIPKCFEPGCDGNVNLIRNITATGLQFKGTGWTKKFHGDGD